jgi:WD40 repeat protein
VSLIFSAGGLAYGFTSGGAGPLLRETQKIVPAIGEGFNATLALHDRTALIGGIAKVYAYDVVTGERLATLSPPTTGVSTESFGEALAIDGNIAIVGAPSGTARRAYAYDATTGAQIGSFAGRAGLNEFGAAVAIHGSHALLGAPDSGPRGGYATLFTTTGAEIRHIQVPSSDDFSFGSSVAIDATRFVIGASASRGQDGDSHGAVYVYDLATASSPLRIAPDSEVGVRLFGAQVAIDGNLLVVGAPGASLGGNDSGAAYLFDMRTGTQLATLVPDDLTESALFGSSVSIRNGLIAVGAGSQDQPFPNSGAVYLYRLDGTLFKTVQPADLEPVDRFGSDVAVFGGRLIASSLFDDDAGDNTGSVYVYAIPEPASWSMLVAALLGLSPWRAAVVARGDRTGA